MQNPEAVALRRITEAVNTSEIGGISAAKVAQRKHIPYAVVQRILKGNFVRYGTNNSTRYFHREENLSADSTSMNLLERLREG